ncbi:MAG: DNA adenine methylase [Lachnospiraceae bacterium]|nr:DNA adenine methylase [Lachnospiraceae bacterium]
MKSILKYIGMKDINLVDYGFSNPTLYCEPFGGSFNTGFKLIEQGYKGESIYNDIDEKVVNFWECIKENNNKVLDRVVQLNNIVKNQFTDSEREMTLANWYQSLDKYKRAAAEFTYRQYLTMDGLKWSVRDTIIDEIDFYLSQEALKSVEICNKDYKEIIGRYDSKDTFFLIDPPYDIDRVSRYYRGDCRKFKHEELANIVKTLEGNWLLTYNDNERIRELYRGFDIKEIKRQLFGRAYTELYITRE